MDRLDGNRLADLRASHTLQGVNVASLLVELESVNEGPPDETSETDVILLVLLRFAHASCFKDAITVSGGDLKLALAVDNDTTLHGVHTDTGAFRILTKCSICSYPQSLTRTPLEWLKKTVHDTYSYFKITSTKKQFRT